MGNECLKMLFFHCKKNKQSIITNLILKINIKEMIKKLKNEKLQNLNKTEFSDIICSNYFLHQNFVIL